MKMAKIVYNACFGGFSLSYAAMMRYAEIKGIKLYAFTDRRGDGGRIDFKEKKIAVTSPEQSKDAFVIYYYTSPDQNDENYFDDSNISRSDPALAQAVEELGDAANGSCAHLRIKEVPSGTLYRIDEYDGRESVMTNSDYEWSVAP